ncbi:AraC family transcriptional regulator [Paenibacillus sp. D2_2]|uniref:AraC family transcriptional regulator n=1 Tax=Paenibacillus sp. D2_2 TaxID=3073092 RepID=UPI0028162570|nr:AraC family transcriptional regulator [Paenibacillus sp. D2_2]WMT39326.1 AraC family transcriptional regulator [Paenibacillus sp. D2_2]
MAEHGAVNLHYTAEDHSFWYHHVRDEHPNPLHYKPHYEKGYEIFMFISGSGNFTIEGSKYELEPYSILMMNSNELHVVNIAEDQPYERAVLTLDGNFMAPFMSSGVDLFWTIKYRRLGQDNQLSAKTVKESGLLELFNKLQRALNQGSAEHEIVAKCIIVQIASMINDLAQNHSPSSSKRGEPKVAAVLEYINNNLDESLTLDLLAEQFFITKYYLCHIFKETTGYTINQYITHKRILKADELMRQGFTATQACFMSGFTGYSSFFKSYRKLTGRTPRGGR